MKTNTVFAKILKVVGLISMTLMLANCAKDKTTATVPTVGTYQMINNLCYQNVNGTMQQVANTALCNQGAGSYVMSGNTCYQVVNGQYIPQANTYLCTNNTNMNGGYMTQVCSGMYTDDRTWVNCGVQMSCSGYTLRNQAGQIVRCQ